MSAAVTFTVPGLPVGKGRPRMTRTGHAFTPAKTRSWEGVVKHEAALAMAGRAPIDAVPLLLDVTAYMAIPPSWSKLKQQRALDGLQHPLGRPDIDNIAKGIADALNGIVYRDDSLITYMVVCKRYSDRPRVEVVVKPLNLVGGRLAAA